ncbi:decapping enzyme, scavenger isoform X2 [Rhodnius prolixus]
MNSTDSKRFKPNNGNEKDTQQGINDLSVFKFERILADHGQRKTICVEGTLRDREGKAILWLEKIPFSEETVKSLCTNKSFLHREFLNDIYGSYTCKTDPDINAIKATIIYPATDQHIAKFEDKPLHIIEETPDLYNNVTLPYILKEQFDIQWVYNVLEHKHETERIIFEDKNPNTGFVLLPDLKWNGKQTEDLYLLALIHLRNIKSLRDLSAEHLPLLRNILNKGTEAIRNKYNIPKSQLRIYIHYQPTFYHLHVHFTYLKYEAPGIFTEKSHLLSSVINNIELLPDYYQKATLSFVLREGENLLPLIDEYIKKNC